jgi:hypothetical protein
VVDFLTSMGLDVVQCGAQAGRPAPWNPELRGVVDLVGRTGVREYFRLIAHADGVLCTITSAMHIAAAFERPCVVWAGGREEPWWEGYVNDYGAFGPQAAPVRVPHRYLHTGGMLPCCEKNFCWKNKVVPEGKDRSLCRLPVTVAGQAVAKCQALIPPEKVIEGVLGYYADGTLPPL